MNFETKDFIVRNALGTGMALGISVYLASSFAQTACDVLPDSKFQASVCKVSDSIDGFNR